MRQLQLFTTAQLATMRDTTRRRNYSAEAEEFRREHQRHRVWGMTQRHARKLRSIYGHMPSDEELTAGWHDRGAVASASGTSEQAHSRPAALPESAPSMPEQIVPEQIVPEQIVPERAVSGQVVPGQVVPGHTVPETAVAGRVATVDAAGGRHEHSVAAGGQVTESESALEEAVVVAAPVRRPPATRCRNWFREKGGRLRVRGGDAAVRPGGKPPDSVERPRFAPSAGDCPVSWTTRFARSPPLRWRLPTGDQYRRFRDSRWRILIGRSVNGSRLHTAAAIC
jgi:hypothetical protein